MGIVAHSVHHNTMLYMYANTPTHAHPVPATPSTHTSAHPCTRITNAKPTHGYLALVLWRIEREGLHQGPFQPRSERKRMPSFFDGARTRANLSKVLDVGDYCGVVHQINLQRSCLCLKTAICHTFAAATKGCEPRARRYGRDIKQDMHYENTVPRQAGLSSKVIATLPGVIHHEFCKDNAKKRNLRTNASQLHSEHFVTNNVVINFHLLFKHISLLDKIGHISAV